MNTTFDIVTSLREAQAECEAKSGMGNPFDQLFYGPAADEIETLRGRVEAAEARLAKHPGDMHWLAEDPECPQECWSSPIVDCYEAPGTVFEMMAAVSLPNIFVTERVLTVDDCGDPDETEPAWFATRAEAQACYPDSLARARAAEHSIYPTGGDAA